VGEQTPVLIGRGDRVCVEGLLVVEVKTTS
jgi:hypothetical protein